jgi:hypothetical protein
MEKDAQGRFVRKAGPPCGHVTRYGVACARVSTTAAGKCGKHFATRGCTVCRAARPTAAAPSGEACGVYTYSATGYCKAHRDQRRAFIAETTGLLRQASAR